MAGVRDFCEPSHSSAVLSLDHLKCSLAWKQNAICFCTDHNFWKYKKATWIVTAYLDISRYLLFFPQITIYLSAILGIYSDFSGIWVTGWWDRYRDESKLIWEGTETWDEQWKHSNNHGGKAGHLSSLKSEQHNITNVNFQRGMTHSLCISRLKSAQNRAPNKCSSNNNTQQIKPKNVLTIDSSGLPKISRAIPSFDHPLV